MSDLYLASITLTARDHTLAQHFTKFFATDIELRLIFGPLHLYAGINANKRKHILPSMHCSIVISLSIVLTHSVLLLLYKTYMAQVVYSGDIIKITSKLVL